MKQYGRALAEMGLPREPGMSHVLWSQDVTPTGPPCLT